VYVKTATGTTGGRVRVGIYDNSSDRNVMPTSLLADFGEIVLDGTTGRKTLALATPYVLAGGQLYWLAMVCNSACRANNAIQTWSQPNLWNVLGAGTAATVNVGYYMDWAYAPLPASFDSATFGHSPFPVSISTRIPSTSIPALALNFAASYVPPAPGGGGGGSPLSVADEGTVITSACVALNFVGPGISAALASAGNVTITVPGQTNAGEWRFDATSTTMADPGSGKLRFNNATLA